jgi:Methyltransferase domain
MMRWREATEIVGTVWQRALLDALAAPRRFRRLAPHLWRASNMVFHPGIAAVPLSSIPSSERPVRMLASGWLPGGTPPQDLYALLRIVRWIEPRAIFEIGTSRGVAAAHLALNSQATIYTLDLPEEMAADVEGYSPGDLQLLQSADEIGRDYRPFNSDGRIRQLFGDSRNFDYRPYCAAMDLVLVDGCHTYEGVLSDSRHAFELLGEKGIILWHDFANLVEVTRAVKTLARKWPISHLEGTCFAMYVRGMEQVPYFSGSPSRVEKEAVGVNLQGTEA